MEERRTLPRKRVYKAGTIAFGVAAGINCILKNVSEGGACLEVESPIGIPEDFTLVIDSEHISKPCHIAWRKAHRIGVRFA
jgi:hypothetical protein